MQSRLSIQYQVCLNQLQPCAFVSAATLDRRGRRGQCAVRGFSGPERELPGPIVRSEIAIKLRSA